MDHKIPSLREWGLPMEQVLLAAGPCSAESEEQVLATAHALAGCGVGFFRAGIWKPRTRPGNFEGVGARGLRWLARVKAETGMAVGTEVATPKHIEACLKYGLDVVWIGARTTPNPFLIQELAEALRGTDLAVFVKNPVSPDLDLWFGAIERMLSVGLSCVGAIHRGFSSVQQTQYRNRPNWKIPIELKRRLPKLPLLCDPSHICGNRTLIEAVAQEAVDLLYDGLMIEVHVDPDQALSDASQQLTPDQFRALLGRITWKHAESNDRTFRAHLDALRTEIDELDDHLLDLLGRRMAVVRRMGELKRQQHVAVLQPGRWEEILASRVAAGQQHTLSADFVVQLFQSVHEEAIRQQEEDNTPQA
jgi:chorismate mutase